MYFVYKLYFFRKNKNILYERKTLIKDIFSFNVLNNFCFKVA